MKFYVENLTHISACTDITDVEASYRFEKGDLPVLDFVPAMQRRRLSIFAKLALYAGFEASKGHHDFPVVFTSRHGDLHKTSTLLDSLANKEGFSPTLFSMSVHNAAPGLLSIFTGNKQASNTVSAGKDTFFMGLVDAYARLSSNMENKVLFIHCDQALPESYHGFNDEVQVDHCVAFLMSVADTKGVEINISKQLDDKSGDDKENTALPQALQFADFISALKEEIKIGGETGYWQLKRKS